MAEWSDELKANVIEKYKAAEPTAETSTEIVKKIADALGDDFTANGVRAILVKAGAYVKKGTAPKEGTADKPKTTRVNKADSIAALSELIEAAGLEVDTDIVSKLTGKAAVYFTEVFEKLVETQEEA
jgi:hypothetical protein